MFLSIHGNIVLFATNEFLPSRYEQNLQRMNTYLVNIRWWRLGVRFSRRQLNAQSVLYTHCYDWATDELTRCLWPKMSLLPITLQTKYIDATIPNKHRQCWPNQQEGERLLITFKIRLPNGPNNPLPVDTVACWFPALAKGSDFKGVETWANAGAAQKQ